MKKGNKIAIILVVGALVAAISYYYLIYKPGKAAGSGAGAQGAGTTPSPAGSGTNTTKPVTVVPANNLVGKNLYAKYANVPVVKVNGTLVKKAALNEWVGLAYAEVTLAGNQFYKVSGDNYVAKNYVYAK